MQKKEMVAMILAGGQGSRLKDLTKDICKPAIPFAGKYRIIDFALSNCTHSGMETVGVLIQYKPLTLNTHIGVGTPWDLDREIGGVHLLAPFMTENGGNWYKGTSDSIYENIGFVDYFEPEYLLILSGDHIYKMDYLQMLAYHKEKNADATIAVIEVPEEDVSRFGIMSTSDDGSINKFVEKPKHSDSRLASMGVYIFKWEKLKRLLIEDNLDKESENDFGKNIIPKMLGLNDRVFAYSFKGYWKDVGTIDSYWEANLDLLKEDANLNLYDDEWRIYSKSTSNPPQYIGKDARVGNSIISDGCVILGEVSNSIIFPNVYVGENTKIMNSVIMANARIEENVIVDKAVIGDNTIIRKDNVIGNSKGIALIAEGREVKSNAGMQGV
jgi:glucose-1-phosphate adenylyltransferase